MQLINKTLGMVIDDLAVSHPNNQAIVYNTRDYTRTWNQLKSEADMVAKGLLSLGVKPGDKVAIWANNVPEWYLTLFGSAKIGGVLVTVNTNYKVFEMEYLLKQSDAKVLVMIDGVKGNDYLSTINSLVPELESAKDGKIESDKFPCLKNIIFAGDPYSTPKGMMNFWSLFDLAKSVTDAEFEKVTSGLAADDIVNIQYTSGTTGFPKGVMLTHKNIINNGNTIGDAMKFTDTDRLMVCVPLFHCFGLVLATMASITHATTMVPIEQYSPIKVMKAIEEQKCTAMHGVPTMFIAILEHPDFDKYNFSTLRTGIMAGSPCPVKVMRQVVDKMNMHQITIVFGQTESSPGCTQTTVDDDIELRVSTVGRVLPGVEAKIVDPETNKELPPHTPGEFVTRGYHIMKGYYKMPEATQLAIDSDGWLHTGDLATCDENGYFKIVGRIRDMIIRGGENIYPKEIEEFLYTNPKVRDVQVIGIPDENYGEEIMACIIPKTGETLDVEEVQDFVRQNMAKHKVPRYVQFMEKFPTNAAGKILKYKMREDAVELLGLDKDKTI